MRMLHDCWQGFWHGATRPSLIALVIAIAVDILALVLVCVYITPDFVAGPMHRYLMQDRFDRILRVTAKTSYSRHSEAPQIAIFGDSLMERCVAGEGRLAEMVTEKTGRPVRPVYDLTAGGQTVWDMLAIAEQLQLSSGPVLIIGVGPGLLSWGMDALEAAVRDTKFGILSETLDTEARSAGLNVPYRSGIYFIDHWRFYLPRLRFLIRNLLIAGPQPDGDPFDAAWTQNVNRPEFWRQEVSNFPYLIRQYDSNRQANLEIIGRIAAQLKTRGNASVVLVESPINPRWYEEPGGKEFFARYRKDLRRFAAEHGLAFLSVSQKAAFLPSDFVDYEGHIGNHEARERCTRAIASQLVSLI